MAAKQTSSASGQTAVCVNSTNTADFDGGTRRFDGRGYAGSKG
jgi:hypothetical protein